MAEAKRNVIKWTKTKYSLKKFTKNYKLPQIVKVMSGWCGNDEQETISSGQILRVARKFNQTRVVAEDGLGRHISIPKDYRFKFNVLPKSEDVNKTYTIEEILSGFTLPQQIQFAKEEGVFVKVAGKKKSENPFGVLKLLRTHEVGYLVCNSMNLEGIVKQPLILPMYIAIEVVVGEGLEKGTKKQWENYQRLRTQAVESHVNLQEVKGNADISIYGTADVSVKRKANPTEKINIYEEIEPKIVRISTSKDQNREREVEQGSLTSDARQDVIEVADYCDIDEREKMPPAIQRRTSSLSSPDKGQYTPFMAELSQYQRLSQTSLKQSQAEGAGEPTYDTIETDEEVKSGPPIRAKPRHSSVALTETDRCVDPPYVKSGQPKPRPAVPPKPTAPPKPVVNTMQVQSEPAEAAVENTTKLPSDVRGLSVEQVCECLRELNLGQYAKDFRENDVDGDFMYTLTPDVMQEDLGMSRLHAMKLDKFMRGWRPKYERNLSS
ncbi:uncharacterized protein [Ptychodera flava]|uniref:uncharacterized protein n=1 Tax=Ptychodera flava TaxID=63121 RepID=UPI00396A265B